MMIGNGIDVEFTDKDGNTIKAILAEIWDSPVTGKAKARIVDSRLDIRNPYRGHCLNLSELREA